ncbi:helix-turn-helix domain-containing protein [Aestuariispira insulae]|uniref:AraC-like DNA-binding protein n=1 Tax=Aestuariispira insulae TaxID=1461337 RepID=A0A3D9HVX0_9PROT|nr:helix-turn-helix domain-containing protein [Aestuariispira insulae]RED53617.1 AraC-like DNA-binding protein [Aestuariispira insulae]
MGEEYPLGELYTRFWAVWLEELSGRLSGMASPRDEEGEQADDPIIRLMRFCEVHGPDRLFREAYRLAVLPAFEPMSFALLHAPDDKAFINRWHGMLEMHGRRLPRDLIRRGENCFYLLPAASVQASGSPLGPPILAAATLGLLNRHGWPIETVWQMPETGGRMAVWRREGAVDQIDMADTGSLWCFEYSAPRGIAQHVTGQSLGYLAQNGRLVKRLEDHWYALMKSEAALGGHISLEQIATAAGRSARSLSRELSLSGVTWRDLARGFRFRAACSFMAGGMECQEEIAFEAGFSDRHHMARDFKRMSAMSPGDYFSVLWR